MPQAECLPDPPDMRQNHETGRSQTDSSTNHERAGESISNKSYIKRRESGLRVQGFFFWLGALVQMRSEGEETERETEHKSERFTFTRDLYRKV